MAAAMGDATTLPTIDVASPMMAAAPMMASGGGTSGGTSGTPVVEHGNLGRAALDYLDLQDTDNYAALATLVAIAVASRAAAAAALAARRRAGRRIKRVF